MVVLYLHLQGRVTWLWLLIISVDAAPILGLNLTLLERLIKSSSLGLDLQSWLRPLFRVLILHFQIHVCLLRLFILINQVLKVACCVLASAVNWCYKRLLNIRNTGWWDEGFFVSGLVVNWLLMLHVLYHFEVVLVHLLRSILGGVCYHFLYLRLGCAADRLLFHMHHWWFSWLWVRVHLLCWLSYSLLWLTTLLSAVVFLFKHWCNLFIWTLQEFVYLRLSLVFNWVVSLVWLSITWICWSVRAYILITYLNSWLTCIWSSTWSSHFFLWTIFHILTLNILILYHFILAWLICCSLKIETMLFCVQRFSPLLCWLPLLQLWLVWVYSRLSLFSWFTRLRFRRSLWLWFSLWWLKLVLSWLRIVLHRAVFFLNFKFWRYEWFCTLFSLMFGSFRLVHSEWLCCLLPELLAESTSLILLQNWIVHLVNLLGFKNFCIVFNY